MSFRKEMTILPSQLSFQTSDRYLQLRCLRLGLNVIGDNRDILEIKCGINLVLP